MVPQLYITMYNEQFRSPGRVKRTELRPTSAHRRNNPQPRPTCTENAGKPQHMPAVNGSTAQDLPSAEGVQKLQLMEFPAGTDIQLSTTLRNPPKIMDNQRNASPLSALQLMQQAGAHLRSRPQTSNLPAAARRFHQPQYRRCCSNSTLDYSSGCYSCFQVVRPYQAGHYIIHPEFVSESLY
ncbi:uncharacterized protein LOC121636985 [Melanotaenia boesemani]|uniref:uncharacterized protein LOC121636985 n=1 Tax=Melanotaenia boesemani TaxID=1250792 RepID=UPI001C047914|nr:uncharacterized protein LOC121636985 [Melanotaenia boesemani]